MTYNLTDIDNNTGLGDFFTNVNTAASGLPAISFIIILWVGTFVYSTNRNLNPGEAFTLTNFLMVIVSGLMYFAQLLNLNVVITLLVMLFIGIGYLMFK